MTTTPGIVTRAIALLPDVYQPARAWRDEHGHDPNNDAERSFTIGYLKGTIESLLDAMGYQEHGPAVAQRQWVWTCTTDDDGYITDSRDCAPFVVVPPHGQRALDVKREAVAVLKMVPEAAEPRCATCPGYGVLIGCDGESEMRCPECGKQ